MAIVSQFSKGLKKLFNGRTAWLHSAIGKKRSGRAPALTKEKLNKELKKLAEMARKIVVKTRARTEFKAVVNAKRQWQVKNKGWGVPAKMASFKRWYEKNIHGRNCVYVFWSGRNCQYVGRTLRGKGRPSSSFDKFWFNSITRIDIYSIMNPTDVPKAECLAIHVFNPWKNKISPSFPKYSKPCPVCVDVKKIRQELNSLFPLRRKNKRKHK